MEAGTGGLSAGDPGSPLSFLLGAGFPPGMGAPESLDIGSELPLPVEAPAPGSLDLGSDLRVRVASDRASRSAAYRLAYDVYRATGLAGEEPRRMIVSRFDTRPETFTLLAEDARGPAGTITLVFDSEDGLPCDEAYAEETDSFRTRDRRLVEVTRLAIRDGCPRRIAVLAHLINLILIYARRVRGGTDFLIEIHPRHALFYQRMLHFQHVGMERPCPRACYAPSVLLRLDLEREEEATRRLGGGRSGADEKRNRTLHRQFVAYEREPQVAALLARQHFPMSEEEKTWFGLTGPEPSALGLGGLIGELAAIVERELRLLPVGMA